MSNLSLIKSESFGTVQCDFWQNESGDVFMTSKQLGQALEYSDPQKGIDNILSRNNYLKKDEFSDTLNLRGPDSKNYNTRIFTEDGIYEVTMLAGTDKAKEFRRWFRKVLKGLRKGQIRLSPSLDEKKKVIEARYNNSLARRAAELRKIADNPLTPKEYSQVLHSKAAEILTGLPLLPLPESERTYSANDIARELNMTANAIGRLANQHNLKTEEYGKLYHDKSPHSVKQVDTWRYNNKGKQRIIEIVKGL